MQISSFKGWKASDGTLFETELDCATYEASLQLNKLIVLSSKEEKDRCINFLLENVSEVAPLLVRIYNTKKFEPLRTE